MRALNENLFPFQPNPKKIYFYVEFNESSPQGGTLSQFAMTCQLLDKGILLGYLIHGIKCKFCKTISKIVT